QSGQRSHSILPLRTADRDHLSLVLRVRFRTPLSSNERLHSSTAHTLLVNEITRHTESDLLLLMEYSLCHVLVICFAQHPLRTCAVFQMPSPVLLTTPQSRRPKRKCS